MPYEKLAIGGAHAELLSWAGHAFSIEEQAMLRNVSRLPCLSRHVALMPDAHLGKGSMVGSVVATKDAVIPATVGVDIGCGMIAVKTPFKSGILDGKFHSPRRLNAGLVETNTVVCITSRTITQNLGVDPGTACFGRAFAFYDVDPGAFPEHKPIPIG